MALFCSLLASPGSHHVLTGPLRPALRYRQRKGITFYPVQNVIPKANKKKTVSLESSYSVSAMHKISLLKSFV